LYSNHCASCHTSSPAPNVSKILNGKDPARILNAIATNKGGMGFLSPTIGQAEANAIASYLQQF